MAKSDVSAADKAAIDKLAAEYSAELNNLGVRVGELENKVDNVKWGGKARLRTENMKVKENGTTLSDVSASHSYFDLWASAKINADWTAKAEFEGEHSMTTGNGDADTGNTSKVYVEGKLFGADATIGKFGAFSKDGMIIDKAVSGAKFAFGNELKTTVTAGTIGSFYTQTNGTQDSANYAAVEFNYAISEDTTVNAGYHQVTVASWKTDNAFSNNDDSVKIWEVGFNTKFGQDWSFVADYAKGNQDRDNTGAAVSDTTYFTQLQYKAADVKKEGSYDIFLNYRKVSDRAQIAQTWGDYAANNKGWALGFDYVPAENVNFQAFYFDGKDVDASDVKTKFVRAQVELFF